MLDASRRRRTAMTTCTYGPCTMAAHALLLGLVAVTRIRSCVCGTDWDGYWLLRDTLTEKCLTNPASYRSWNVTNIEDCAANCLRDYPNCKSATFDGSTCEGNGLNDADKLSTCNGKQYLPMVSLTKDLSSVKLDTKISEGYTCEPGWKGYESGCFLYNDSPVSFDEADRFCRLNLAHVVSIHHQPEHQYVINLVPDNVNKVYIGYMKAAHDRGYYWSDGSNDTYSSWADPASLLHAQNQHLKCVRMSRDVEWNWQIVSCNEIISFICKKAGVK